MFEAFWEGLRAGVVGAGAVVGFAVVALILTGMGAAVGYVFTGEWAAGKKGEPEDETERD